MFKIFKKIKDDSYEFKPVIIEIEDTPQNPLGRTILYIVLSLIIFTFLWLFLAKIDIVVSSQGKVIPNGEIKILKPLESGVVSKILVKEGDKVLKGDTLMSIDPSVTTVNLQTKENELNNLNMSIIRLRALGNESNLTNEELNLLSNSELNLFLNQKNSYDNSINQYKFSIEELNFNIESSKDEIIRLNNLLNKNQNRLNRLEKVRDIISLKEYDELQKEVYDLTSKLNIAKNNKTAAINKLNATKEELEVFKQNSKGKFLDELIAKQKEANLIKAEINAYLFQSKQQLIKSPVDGYVGKLLVNTESGVVNSGEALITIIPANEPLIIKATTLNKDIGFLKEGQKVAIKIDTFNFQKYGKLDGELIHIANDAIEDEKLGIVYEIKVKPLKTTLNIDGEIKNIEPGMSVIAEVKVGKRRVIELFIYPIIKYLDEGLSVR
ncbi:HlyD family type I secretion periplasmic adaptor subunit [Campylobacter ureolyticus]|uniref:HlyD family type I secretion periplasmic adaptor subunit n=3 Tax=Campylobacter ureolyticus TaxID=827 RepID=A0A9Q4PWB6_9BACT|nr:HlyD family type I secretion periplasmic adaptor subunit [Campylobacter ureolyticus]MCZ6160345.1 HlyD family type I secretion periplasmic adaptor subunit [Campylobacter ureolyticus]MCZ6163375.1 HlyD family type I secretion periplasmic adaptor subunit [Campylobacter ureolyticus]MCZ6165227.1 HlyD family type I secretion periplasmic adaptor subunit [Campylobacter ureolyticus]MCZ6167216.1 HlyD family type I secretion periplasmic adaptor subunit [Campylobacter ureolyticus]MCZ6173960.1 HlyD famil